MAHVRACTQSRKHNAGPPRARITALYGNDNSRYYDCLSYRLSFSIRAPAPLVPPCTILDAFHGKVRASAEQRSSSTETGDDRLHPPWRVKGKTPLKLVLGTAARDLTGDVIAACQRVLLSFVQTPCLSRVNRAPLSLRLDTPYCPYHF